MATTKHTIKECKKLLRSCASMLNSLSGTDFTIEFADWLLKCYRAVANLASVYPESQLTEPWLFNRIVSLYNEINSKFITL